MVQLICILMPRSLSLLNPAIDRSNEPGIFRNSSWVLASAPSKLIDTLAIPASTIFLAVASSTNVPFVASATLNPLLTAYFAISKISGLKRGSPPLSTRMGLPVSATASTKANASCVVMSSLARVVLTSNRRQWTHSRLHPTVVSQNCRLLCANRFLLLFQDGRRVRVMLDDHLDVVHVDVVDATCFPPILLNHKSTAENTEGKTICGFYNLCSKINQII